MVPYNRGTVTDAPNVDVDNGHLSQEEEANLYRYYGRQYAEAARPDPNDYSEVEGWEAGSDSETAGSLFRDAGGNEPSLQDSSDDAMTRSDEQLHV